MSDAPKKKASLLVRGFVFCVLAALMVQAGMFVIILLGLVAGAAWIGLKAGKIKLTNELQPRILKYVTLAALFALPGAHGVRQEAAKSANNEKMAVEELAQAKELLSQKKYLAAAQRLDHILQLKNSQAIEAKSLLDYAEIFTVESAANTVMLQLSRSDFDKLLAGQTISLNSNLAYNQELNTFLQSKAEKFKATYLSIKIEAEKLHEEEIKNKKVRDRRIASFGEPPTQSAWDGSYSVVSRFLKDRANDPGSISIIGCTKVSADDSVGWVVGCDFRGKNAFGALIKNSNWFVIKHGQVVQALPPNAYK